MKLNDIHELINEAWQLIIKPYWDKTPLSDNDLEKVVDVSGRLGDKYGDTFTAAKIINGFIDALEIRDKEMRNNEQNDK